MQKLVKFSRVVSEISEWTTEAQTILIVVLCTPPVGDIITAAAYVTVITTKLGVGYHHLTQNSRIKTYMESLQMKILPKNFELPPTVLKYQAIFHGNCTI